MKSLPTALLATLTVLLAFACKEPQQGASPSNELSRQTVRTAIALRAPVSHDLQMVGTVVARNRAEIASKVSGTVSSLSVVLGSEVRPGSPLLEISAGEIDARLRQAEAHLVQAQRNLGRERKLLARNAATPETVKEMEEALALAEATRDEARIMQGYTRIESPLAGRITAKMVDRGDFATPGTPLLVIEDGSQLQIETSVPEAMLPAIAPGQIFTVQVPAADLTATAMVNEVAPAINPTSRSGRVKLDLEAHPNLRPGQFARVALTTGATETLSVPAKALVRRGQLELLYVVVDSTARLRLVRAGAVINERIEILSGLDGGEMVVVDGQHLLQDGQPVMVEAAPEQPASDTRSS